MDYGLEVEIHHLWSDRSTGVTAAKHALKKTMLQATGFTFVGDGGPQARCGCRRPRKHTVKLVRVNPLTSWKPVFPFKPTPPAIAGITMATQILGEGTPRPGAGCHSVAGTPCTVCFALPHSEGHCEGNSGIMQEGEPTPAT